MESVPPNWFAGPTKSDASHYPGGRHAIVSWFRPLSISLNVRSPDRQPSLKKNAGHRRGQAKGR
jgi:hypothetical protein